MWNCQCALKVLTENRFEVSVVLNKLDDCRIVAMQGALENRETGERMKDSYFALFSYSYSNFYNQLF
jgi:hypothetical protein